MTRAWLPSKRIRSQKYWTSLFVAAVVVAFGLVEGQGQPNFNLGFGDLRLKVYKV